MLVIQTVVSQVHGPVIRLITTQTMGVTVVVVPWIQIARSVVRHFTVVRKGRCAGRQVYAKRLQRKSRAREMAGPAIQTTTMRTTAVIATAVFLIRTASEVTSSSTIVGPARPAMMQANVKLRGPVILLTTMQTMAAIADAVFQTRTAISHDNVFTAAQEASLVMTRGYASKELALGESPLWPSGEGRSGKSRF